MSIESVIPSSHLILCHTLLLLPPIPPSIRVFCNESTLRIRSRMCWSFNFSIIFSKEHPGVISFRMDWLDLLVVQGTHKGLQHHSSKTSVLCHSAFFTLQLSHPYMTTGKTTALVGCHFLGDLPDPGIEPTILMSLALTGGFFTTSTTGEVCGKTLYWWSAD